VGITITEMKSNKEVYALLDEWEERTQAVVAALPRMVAEDVLNEIKKDAPKDITGYPDMLQVVSIPKARDWAIFGIVPEGSAGTQRLEAVDVQRTVLYVRPKIIRGIASPAAVVLERKNPWTMDTLPYEPKLREASLISRRVTEHEVKAIENQRNKEREAVEVELRELGVQLRSKGKVLVERRVTRDLAWEVLRHEFGIPPVRGKAHWRPAVAKWKQFAEARLKKDLLPWVADPENSDWRRGDTVPDGKASAIDDLQRFEEIVMTGRVGGV
jgi:hypothetical protein